MKRFALIAGLGCALLAQPGWSATVYKVVAADGSISYSDVPPPPAGGGQVQRIETPEYAAPADAGPDAALDAMRETTERMRRDRLEREQQRAAAAPPAYAPEDEYEEDTEDERARGDIYVLPPYYGGDRPRRGNQHRPPYPYGPGAPPDALPDPARAASPEGLRRRMREMR